MQPNLPASGTNAIVITPQRSEVYMNGVKYYDFDIGGRDWNERVAKANSGTCQVRQGGEGYIDLQEHPGEVAFRNIKIRPLPDKMKAVHCHPERSEGSQ